MDPVRPTTIDTIKGCEAIIILAKTDFRPGKVVEGELKLNVTAAVDCEAFTLTLKGIDKLHWEIGGDDSEYFEKVHEIIKQEVSLHVLQPLQTSIPVGQHVYPFAFPLPSSLPASCHTLPLQNERRIIVYYEVVGCILPKTLDKAKIADNGREPDKTKTVARGPFTIHPVPLPAAEYPGVLVKATVVSPVQRCCFKVGACVQSLIVGLRHSLNTHIPGEEPQKFSNPMFPFHEQTFVQVVQPHTAKEDIQLKVSMADARAGFEKENKKHMPGWRPLTSSTFVPTSDYFFASLKYHISVTIRFNSFLPCTEVTAELPIKLLTLTS